MSERVYKLRDRKTGLYAGRGLTTWTKRGKSWATRAHLKAAITRTRGYYGRRSPIPDQWEVVAFILTPTFPHEPARKLFSD